VNTRRLAPVALAAAIMLGATGCSMLSPQATTIPYSAAEGVNISASGPLAVRNALLVSNEDGSASNFLAAIVNDTDDSHTLVITIDGKTERVRVAARSWVSLGFDGVEPLLFEGLGAAPGTNQEVTFDTGDGDAVEHSVPVLDGALDYLAEFVPES
jgi:hypothetical protein